MLHCLRTASRLPARQGVRCLASKAGNEVPLPVRLYGIPARYANATYRAASKVNKLDAVESDLAAFTGALNKTSLDYFKDPTVPREVKVQAMEKIFDSKKTSDITKNLLITLAANARLGDINQVVSAFGQLMRAQRGEVDAVVTTAEALTGAQQKTLTAALNAHVGAGKTVAMELKVDPSLLGGITVHIGDQVLDLSIHTKIEKMKATLQSFE